MEEEKGGGGKVVEKKRKRGNEGVSMGWVEVCRMKEEGLGFTSNFWASVCFWFQVFRGEDHSGSGWRKFQRNGWRELWTYIEMSRWFFFFFLFIFMLKPKRNILKKMDWKFEWGLIWNKILNKISKPRFFCVFWNLGCIQN